MSKWGAVCQVILELHKLNGIPKTGVRSRSIVLRIPFELPPAAVAQIYEDARDATRWRTGEHPVRMKLPIEETAHEQARTTRAHSIEAIRVGDAQLHADGEG